MSSHEQELFDCQSRGHLVADINITSIQIGDVQESVVGNYQETCMFHCNVTLPHNVTCDENAVSPDRDVNLTLWLFVGIKSFLSFTTALSFTLFEMASLSIVRDCGHDYTLQRAYGSIGLDIVK